MRRYRKTPPLRRKDTDECEHCGKCCCESLEECEFCGAMCCSNCIDEQPNYSMCPSCKE